MNLPLTRRNLVAFTRWREEQDPGRRQSWERVCGLHPDEVRALEALDANLLACGPVTSWWVENAGYRDGIGGLHLRSGLAEHLCHGLAVDEHALPELVRVCGVHDGWPARRLENGLRAYLGLAEPAREKVKAGASFSAECMRIGGADETTPKWSRDAIAGRHRKETGMVAESNGHAAGAKMAGVREELKKLDLSQPVPNSVKRDLAKQFDCSDATVSTQVSVLRRELGIAAPDRSSWSREREKFPAEEDETATHGELERMREERGETARMLAEVRQECDRLRAARGPDPEAERLRANVEALKEEVQDADQRREASDRALALRDNELEAARAQRDEAIRERDAAKGLAERRAAQIETLKKTQPRRYVPGSLTTAGQLNAVRLAAGEALSLSHEGLGVRITLFRLALEILELATR